MQQDQEFFTTAEAEAALGISNKTLKRWRASEDPPIKPRRAAHDNRLLVYARVQVEQMAAAHGVRIFEPRLTLEDAVRILGEHERKIARLEQQMEALLRQVPGVVLPPMPPLPTLRPARVHRATPLKVPEVPEGYVLLDEFARRHGLTGSTSFQAMIDQLRPGEKAGKRMLLGQPRRTIWVHRHHQRTNFLRCPECPEDLAHGQHP